MEQEFNFSSEYRFKYTKATQELNVEKNNLFIPDFFQRAEELEDGRGRIVNITGIIGKNGAGKTTVLDFIKENLVYGAGGLNQKAIIIIRDERGTQRIFSHVELGISKGNYRYFNLEDPLVYHDDMDTFTHLEIHYLDETSVIFYSTIFDAKQEFEWMGMRNISTNYLVKQIKRHAVEMKQVDRDFSEIELYRRSEVKKQLEFINSQRSGTVDLPMKLPEYATITPRLLNPVLISKGKQGGQDKGYDSFDAEFNFWLRNLEHSMIGNERVKMLFKSAILGNFVYDLMNFLSIHLSSNYFYERGLDMKNTQDPFVQIDRFVIIIRDFIESMPIRDEGLLELIHNIMQLLNKIDVLISSYSNVVYSSLRLPLVHGLDSAMTILEVLELHNAATLFSEYFEFDWVDLSSGQKALLSMYSRFFSLCDEQERASNMHLSKNLLILIDEGELYLHPEWQRNFLNNLVEYLPKIYKGKNIQIIFTSNSPVIISDLPNSNLIFIDRSEKGCTVIDGLIEHKQTFAANIHTLYSDAFFMEKGLVGEFANKKILNLIHTIHSIVEKEEFIEVEKELDILISQIGEPVLRGKLHSLMKEKREKYIRSDRTNQELMNMIRNMQQEINQLKQERSE
ncbi:AAA family ATPase [Paenibacillus sp. 22594]|uniref:AAA family ATPase n=1 Tax=Paenibacillus sp. 22594 TaxID=3453947 RepID=UPI003F87D927